eukprot:6189122-Pleurochrysis_carterae.AAC.1
MSRIPSPKPIPLIPLPVPRISGSAHGFSGSAHGFSGSAHGYSCPRSPTHLPLTRWLGSAAELHTPHSVIPLNPMPCHVTGGGRSSPQTLRV